MALLSSMGVADRSLAERRHLFSTFDSLECYYLPVEMQKFFRTITGFVGIEINCLEWIFVALEGFLIIHLRGLRFE